MTPPSSTYSPRRRMSEKVVLRFTVQSACGPLYPNHINLLIDALMEGLILVGVKDPAVSATFSSGVVEVEFVQPDP